MKGDFLFNNNNCNDSNDFYELKIQLILKESFDNYLKLFSCNNSKVLSAKLKELNQEAGSVCAGKMIKIGGWKCSDCEKNANAIICHECWKQIKDKHLSHDIKYNGSTNGTCDCGDLNTVEASLFCPNHKGPLTKEEDIQNYINKNIPPELIQSFEKYTEDLIKNILPYIADSIEKKKIDDLYFKENMKEFINQIEVLSNNNALMHILSKIFLKNYKIKTTHNCLLINDNEIKFIIKSNEVHNCVCPLIRYLMEGWVDNNQDVLYRFLLNYKLRKTMGVLYFILFEHFTKYCITDICELSVQYIFDDVCTTASSTPGIIGYYFDSLKKIIEYFTDNILNNENDNFPLIQQINNNDISIKNKTLKNTLLRIAFDTIYLIKPQSAKYLGNNEKIYLRLINILSKFQNINPIKSFYPHLYGYYKDSFSFDLIQSENYLLMIFDFYISILNFKNKALILTLFKNFSEAIINNDNNSNNLKKDEYSFHYSLYRGFSIFLIRYCYHYINYNNIDDINEGFKEAMKYIPNFKTFGEIIINNYFKLFGYINACGENFLNYYGEFMPYNEIYYFDYKEFILRDFILVRFILSCNIFRFSFSLLNIFEKCSLEKTYDIMEKHLFSKDNIPPEKDFINEVDIYKYMNFNGKILKIILNITRENTCFLWGLGSSHQSLKNGKISTEITRAIIMNDKENIKEICKKIIINEILSKENLNTFTDISEAIFTSFHDIFGEDKIENLILSMTNKTLTQNKKAKFSIKDENLKYLDISSVYNFKEKSNIQKYINNFKKEKISVYNTYFYPFSKYEVNLQNNIYLNFYLNQENFNIIFKMTELLLNDEKYSIFQQFFLSELINYWNIFFYLYENNNDEYYKTFLNKNEKNIIKIINLLRNNTLNDDSLKDFCESVIKKTTKINRDFNIEITQENTINLENKNKEIGPKSSMKEKMKNKFKKKFSQLEQVYNIGEIEEEKKVYEPCIYCLKPIEPNDINNLYGKVGNITYDYLFFNSFSQTIKKEFKNYSNNDKDFNEIIFQSEKIKGYNIYSCNHFIHYSCFIKLDPNNLKCPFCNQIINLFIPFLSQYNNKDSYYIFKGVNLLENEQNNFCFLIDNNKFYISISEEEKMNKELKFDTLALSDQYLFKVLNNYEDKDIFDKILLTKKVLENISNIFSNFFDMIEIFDDIKNKIENFKNLVLVIRLLLKIDKLDYGTLFNTLISLLKEFINLNEEENFTKIIFEDNLKMTLLQILIIISILFDYDTINGYEKYIMKLFLPIYTIQYYIRHILLNNKLKFNYYAYINQYNITSFNEYLKNDIDKNKIIRFISKNIMLTNLLIRNNNNDDISFELNTLLDNIGLSNYKSKTFKEIINMVDSFVGQESKNIIDSFFMQFLPKMKVNDFFTEIYSKIFENYITKKYKMNKFISPYLLASCLPFNYNFIKLPIRAIDFQFDYFNVSCSYCNEHGYPFLLCLTCEKKICNIEENMCHDLNLIMKHNEECGGGRSIYLNNLNYKIVLIDKNSKFEVDIPFYVNKFGESIDSNVTSKDIILNEEEIKKALKLFINYSWTNISLIKQIYN